MTDREKLIELITDAMAPKDKLALYGAASRLVDYLIANGVTVQEGKPLEAFLHPIDAYKGLKAKYLVFKADTGEQVENCFVLRPDKDLAAVAALRAYAEATDNDTLADDIYNWVGKGGSVHKWIPVTERLPSEHDADADLCVLAIHKACNKRYWHWRSVKDNLFDFTHWMPTPEPPKEGEHEPE